ncbi:hypothetical protein [Rhizobium sullae]|uniref:Threonine/homoserine/homoserine lactone efflux protein n=1 Tax=Rhizobium sullae TaxID=50338 RepID=A0A4R3PXF8_RHISU|nr:hypothetical protein [Rhizobium sullae]TCU13328.1 threonine/homoserine/homoserine lactone efflux protein [Rhizobium sullae]
MTFVKAVPPLSDQIVPIRLTGKHDPISMAAGAFALIAMPGPTNTLLALAAYRRGVWQLAILATTVVAAYLLVVVLLTVLTGGLLHSHPQVAAALKLVSATWVLYLAFRLWSAAGPLSAADLSVRHVLITTLLNPKAIIIGLAMVPAAGVSTQIPHLLAIAFAVAARAPVQFRCPHAVFSQLSRQPFYLMEGTFCPAREPRNS